MLDKEKIRAGLLGGAGVYLIYIAYSLFQERHVSDSSMPLAVNYLFSALFALVGAALGIYAIRLWRISVKRDEEAMKEDQQSDSVQEPDEEQSNTRQP